MGYNEKLIKLQSSYDCTVLLIKEAIIEYNRFNPRTPLELPTLSKREMHIFHRLMFVRPSVKTKQSKQYNAYESSGPGFQFFNSDYISNLYGYNRLFELAVGFQHGIPINAIRNDFKNPLVPNQIFYNRFKEEIDKSPQLLVGVAMMGKPTTPEQEKVIATDPYTSLFYSIFILGDRFKIGEVAIKTNPITNNIYANLFDLPGKGRINYSLPDIVNNIIDDLRLANNFKQPWPLLEKAMLEQIKDEYPNYTDEEKEDFSKELEIYVRNNPNWKEYKAEIMPYLLSKFNKVALLHQIDSGHAFKTEQFIIDNIIQFKQTLKRYELSRIILNVEDYIKNNNDKETSIKKMRRLYRNYPWVLADYLNKLQLPPTKKELEVLATEDGSLNVIAEILTEPLPADFEKSLLNVHNTINCIQYCINTKRGRWLDLEKLLIQKRSSSCCAEYASDVIKGPWPEAEKIIKRGRPASIKYFELTGIALQDNMQVKSTNGQKVTA